MAGSEPPSRSGVTYWVAVMVRITGGIVSTQLLPATAILRVRMALFSSDAKESLKRLANKDFGSAEVRDELLGTLDGAEGLRARDVTWMLFRPDRAFRDAGAKVLQRLQDPEALFVFLNETKSKPE